MFLDIIIYTTIYTAQYNTSEHKFRISTKSLTNMH